MNLKSEGAIPPRESLSIFERFAPDAMGFPNQIFGRSAAENNASTVVTHRYELIEGKEVADVRMRDKVEAADASADPCTDETSMRIVR